MKKILITGASRGFGFCIAKNFLRTDNKIINIGRTKPDLPLLHIDCDFQSTKSIEEVINKESLLNCHFDIIILNAGTLGNIKKATNVSKADLLNSFNINFFSNKILIDFCLSQARDSQKYIYISSGASQKGYTGWLEYCTSKSAFDSLIRVYSRENVEHIFLSISPGALDTSMQEKIKYSNIKDFKDMAKFIDLRKSGGLRDPDSASLSLISFIENMSKEMSGNFYKI